MLNQNDIQEIGSPVGTLPKTSLTASGPAGETHFSLSVVRAVQVVGDRLSPEGGGGRVLSPVRMPFRHSGFDLILSHLTEARNSKTRA